MLLTLLAACAGPSDPKDTADATDTADTAETDTADTAETDTADTAATDTAETDTADTAETDTADTGPVDADADGHASVESGGDDCDDADATVYPGAPTLCDDAKVNDCDLTSEGAVCATCTGDQTGSTATATVTGSADQGLYSIRRTDDFDGDGVGDLVAEGFGDRNGDGAALYLWATTSAGAALPADTSAVTTTYVSGAGTPTWLDTAGDADGDGAPDLMLFDDGALVVLPSSAVAGGGTLGRSDAGFVVASPDYFWSAEGGDVDGDGAKDVIVGDSSASGTFRYEGAAYVFSFAQVQAGGTLAPEDATIAVYGGEANASAEVGSVVDVDGDGVDDLLATAYLGSASVDAVFLGPLSPGALTIEDGDVVVTLRGDTSYGLADVGDLDGDGLEDVGTTRFYTPGGYIYLGGGALSARGAVDADSYDLFFAVQAGWWAFAPHALGGDFDGDAADDVFVGASSSGTNQMGGVVYAGPFGAGSSYAVADATAAYDVHVSSTSGSATYAARDAGDLDLDGQPDLMVGSSTEDGADKDSGLVWIFGGCTP